MKVFDLFAGTGSATQAARDRGHDVRTLDVLAGVDYQIDVKMFAKEPDRYLRGWRPDYLWASPPCTKFSMAGSGSRKHGSPSWEYAGPYEFYGPRLPLDQAAREGCAYVLAALRVIDFLRPRFWWLENPMGGLMTMGFMRRVPGPVIVTYCQYGESRMKPTTLWGKWPDAWKPRSRCKNGDTCHEAAPRGAKTGTQGIQGAAARAMVPYALSMEICQAVEVSL